MCRCVIGVILNWEESEREGFCASDTALHSGLPTSFPSYPAVHDSLHRFKLVFLELWHIFTQNLHQVVRVCLQLLVLLVADVDGGLPPGA